MLNPLQQVGSPEIHNNPLQQAGSPEIHNNPLDGDDPMDVDASGGGISAENDRLQQQLGFVGQPSPPSGAPASSKIATIMKEVSGSEKKLVGLKVKTKFTVFCSAVLDVCFLCPHVHYICFRTSTTFVSRTSLLVQGLIFSSKGYSEEADPVRRNSGQGH